MLKSDANVFTLGVPSRGMTWAFGANDAYAACTGELDLSQEFTDDDQSKFWIAKTKFAPVAQQNGGSQGSNPTLDPPTVSGGTEQQRFLRSVDKDGNRLENSAHEPLIGDAVSRDIATPTVEISMNQLDCPVDNLDQYINHVNSSALWGFESREVKLVGCSWDKQLFTTLDFVLVYYRVTYTFKCDATGFDDNIIDEGTKVLIPGGDKDDPGQFRRATVEGTDEKESNPILLDGNGSRLAPGDNPVFLTYEIEPEANFLSLGIPTEL